MTSTTLSSLGDYDADLYGPFLGISDDGSAAEAIRDAALSSPKARALSVPEPLAIGVAHDAERLRSIGEVPVGLIEYERIRSVASGRILITTNVGSHVNIWHYLQPPAFDVSTDSTPEEVQAWALEHGAGLRNRSPQPWLRLRFDSHTLRDTRIEILRAAAAAAPVCIAVRAEEGLAEVRSAIDMAASAGAPAVVVDGRACAPSESRPALPGLLNYFSTNETGELLSSACEKSICLEPALKVDTDSVANQIWTGLFAARAMGLNLGKYGLFPLTFQEMAEVVGNIQLRMHDWTAAPVFYIDVPWVNRDHVYDLSNAAAATTQWLDLVAGLGARVVLIDTVDKAKGRHLVKTAEGDATGIFSWDEVDDLRHTADTLNLRVLWAGGIPLSQVREFGRRRAFGVYVTTAAAEARPLGPNEQGDIGLISAKVPIQDKIALVKLLLEAGFLDDKALEKDAVAAERGDTDAVQALTAALIERWRQRLAGGP